MNTLIYLIPVALSLGGLGLVAFLWALKSGQYEDLDGASWRVLDDGDGKGESSQTLFDQDQPTETDIALD
ncbi:cbb3-type cytochrome oxidase assembly protein CcoS [Sinorhizobium meliloti]|uniref:cbb3-type cytochrome oxidase assembly protein CcoS n=1 Tax=Rhizobium meliloti TaxID=382 RepID=UPI000FDC4FB7|nr:cbb3-type cytochrome oxidase assembly protein CcoS [Sinorhizobium meliloti]RVG66219.1 cbb3-type cytochrome oxidase assembly protein CcoS [Sinorhizobium meliloti]RVH34717.1 cbb3-type cytochrome oxidase assembly protein CcoS [Sinorhizobium meliloti]RVH46602.1 cbb3-type cytochrome oxidase assembly protein CcoS [Sinorhizobium meliloti]